MSHPNFILDKRVVHRNISKGILTQKDLDDSIAKLVDVADNAEVSRPEGPEETEATEGETTEAEATEAEAGGDAAPSE